MSKYKFSLAVAQNIATKTNKIKQLQKRSDYKYFQNITLYNQRPDIFVKSGNPTVKDSTKSITEEITNRIFLKYSK